MSKVYLKVEVAITVDTDLTSTDDIMDAIDLTAVPCGESVEVYDCTVTDYQVTDAK